MENSISEQLMTWQTQTAALIDSAKSILIASIKPDDDAVASVLALYSILRIRFPEKLTKMAICSYKNNRYVHLRHFDKINFVSGLQSYFADFDLIIFADTAELDRFKISPEELKTRGIKSICIDHHHRDTTINHFTVSCIDKKATSSTEIVYKIFLRDTPNIDENLAETLLVGLMGDTGSLRYIDYERIDVYEIIKRLISEKNLNVGSLSFLWRKCTNKQFEIIGKFMSNARLFRDLAWPTFSAAFISREEMTRNNYSLSDINEAASFYISNLGMVVDDTDWAIALFPYADGDVKVKVRANPVILNAHAICKALRIGSGHFWASGGKFVKQGDAPREPEQCLDEVLHFLKVHVYDRLKDKVVPSPSGTNQPNHDRNYLN